MVDSFKELSGEFVKLLKEPVPSVWWTITGFFILYYFFRDTFLSYGLLYQLIFSYGIGFTQLTINRMIGWLLERHKRIPKTEYDIFTPLNCAVTISLISIGFILVDIDGLFKGYVFLARFLSIILVPVILFIYLSLFNNSEEEL